MKLRVDSIDAALADMAKLTTGGKGRSVQVLVNPSAQDMQNSMIKEFRTARDASGDIYVWPADEAIHRQVVPALERTEGAEFEAFDMASDVLVDDTDLYEYWNFVDRVEAGEE